MKVVTRKPSVYQSTLTGHWIVDEYGSKEHPGSKRQGWRNHKDALADAASKVHVMEVLDEDYDAMTSAL